MVWTNRLAGRSSATFDKVIPELEWYFNGKIFKVEDDSNPVCKLLDHSCAVDALVKTDHSIFGIAHRVNYADYESFTVRFTNGGTESEWDHITRSGIKPRYHVQTLFTSTTRKIAIVKTEDLVECIREGLAEYKVAQSTGASFASIDWITVQARGYNVDIIDIK